MSEAHAHLGDRLLRHRCALLAASNLDAQLFPLTGEIRFRNSSASAVPFAYYSITSPSGALNGSELVWKSIADNLRPRAGNGFIDPNGEWVELSALSTQLTEGALPALAAAWPRSAR